MGIDKDIAIPIITGLAGLLGGLGVTWLNFKNQSRVIRTQLINSKLEELVVLLYEHIDWLISITDEKSYNYTNRPEKRLFSIARLYFPELREDVRILDHKSYELLNWYIAEHKMNPIGIPEAFSSKLGIVRDHIELIIKKAEAMADKI